MRAERHVAGKSARHRERLIELVGRSPERPRVADQPEPGVRPEAADDHHVVSASAFGGLQRQVVFPRVSRRQSGDERRAAERYLVAVVQHPVDRMLLAARFHRLQRRHVFGHGHHLGARQLLTSVAFLVIAVRVAAEQDLRVVERSRALDRSLDRRDVPLAGAVDENVALRRHDPMDDRLRVPT